ncbi:MAG: Rieske (2Fe-2S) protein [Bryobacteraceae bacterium]|nr:Rieske (2Fe-2S) protein [Bryobacteraceae bacterium]MDW8377296.1 Rieske (2Fe-2S) protein [Bryobacterales bacterium]
MPFEFAAKLHDIPPGALRDVRIQGVPVALANVEGKLFAVEGTCPHRGAPLGQGALHGATLVCPWHAWAFDCVTGEHDYNPAICLKRYEVMVENGEVFINIESDARGSSA